MDGIESRQEVAQRMLAWYAQRQGRAQRHNEVIVDLLTDLLHLVEDVDTFEEFVYAAIAQYEREAIESEEN